MRQAIYLSMLYIAMSCSPAAQEIAITNHESVINGVKTDLSLEIVSLSKVGTITFLDSARILDSLMDAYAHVRIKKEERDIRDYEVTIKLHETQLKYEDYPAKREHLKKSIKMYGEFLAMSKKMLTRWQNRYFDSTSLHNVNQRSIRYKTNPDSLFAERYLCTYTIKNPLLNNVTQELTKEYVISLDGSKVYAAKSLTGSEKSN